MRISVLLFLATLSGGVACTQKASTESAKNKPSRVGNSEDITPQKPNGGEAKSANGSASNPPGASTDDDQITVPNNIAGAHLTCAIRKEASASSLESEIGCLLADQTTNKKLGPDAKLSFTNNSPMQVTSELQPETSIYHVLYRVKGESREAILQLTQSLEAIVLYSDKNIKTEKIVRVLKPAIELEDYQAPIVREQSIDKDDAGSL